MYVNHTVQRTFQTGKLGIRFRIVSFGDGFEKTLMLWYRVRLLSGRSFTCGPHSKLARDWRLIFRRGADRWDRLPLTALRDVKLRAKVRTVQTDYEQNALDPVN